MYFRDEKKKQAADKKETDAFEAKLILAERDLLATEYGRAYLWWLMEIGKAIGHVPATANALTTHFGCGEMNVGVQIMGHLIETDQDGFFKVLKENGNAGRDSSRNEDGGDSGDNYDGNA